MIQLNQSQNKVDLFTSSLPLDPFLNVVENFNGDIRDVVHCAITCKLMYEKISSAKTCIFKICLKSIEKELSDLIRARTEDIVDINHQKESLRTEYRYRYLEMNSRFAIEMEIMTEGET